MITIYGMRASGNCYKLQLLLDQLGREYRCTWLDRVQAQPRYAPDAAHPPVGAHPVGDAFEKHRPQGGLLRNIPPPHR